MTEFPDPAKTYYIFKDILSYIDERGARIDDYLFNKEGEVPVRFGYTSKVLSQQYNYNPYYNGYPEEITISETTKLEIIGRTIYESVIPFIGALDKYNQGDYENAGKDVAFDLLFLGADKGIKILSSVAKYKKLGGTLEIGSQIVQKGLLTQDKIVETQNIAAGEITERVLFKITYGMYEDLEITQDNKIPVDNGDGTITYYPQNIKISPYFDNDVLYIPIGGPKGEFVDCKKNKDLPPPEDFYNKYGINIDKKELRNIAVEINNEIWKLQENDWQSIRGKYESEINEAIDDIIKERYEK